MAFPDGAPAANYWVFSERTMNSTYTYESHKVITNGTDSSNWLEVADVGQVWINTVQPDSLVYFTNPRNYCNITRRCSIIEVFEAYDTSPWYYKCNITLGYTLNDPKNVSYVSDEMASIATKSIAQSGAELMLTQQSQIYPLGDINFGTPFGGDKDAVGFNISAFALTAIAGAAIYNPQIYYEGISPSPAFQLGLEHPKWFYVVLSLLCGFYLLFCIIVAAVANSVRVRPDEYLSMSLLLRSIAEILEGVSGGREDRKYDEMERGTRVKYEEDRRGRWILKFMEMKAGEA